MSLGKLRGFQSGRARVDTVADAASVAEIPAPVFPNRERGEPSSFDTIAHRRRTTAPYSFPIARRSRGLRPLFPTQSHPLGQSVRRWRTESILGLQFSP